MKHPGFYRAVPGAILGFVIGELIVIGIRSMQGLPVWDTGVAIVLAPFTMMVGWMWGVGAFNPKLSEHGEHHDEHAIVEAESAAAHHEEEQAPASIFFTEVWKAATLPLLLLLVIFAFANLPDGFGIQITTHPDANAAVFSNAITVNLPILGIIHTTQMAVFLAFVAWLVISLIIFAGIIGFLMYKSSEQIAIVTQTEPSPEALLPPPPVRWLGRGAKALAKNLRTNLPKFFGQ